jgi:hypothetical protein
MSFDWLIQKSPKKNGKFDKDKILTYIGQNDSIALKTLIENDYDCDARCKYQGSDQAIVMIASAKNQYECVKVLCEAKCNLSPQIGHQLSPLVSAILNQNLEMVKLMLEHRVNVNEPCNLTGRTPLGYAANERNLDIVKDLVKAGADKEKKDRSGHTPLLMACQNTNLVREKFAIIQFLLGEGSNPFCIDEKSNSCLQYLCITPPYTENHILAVKNLLDKMKTKSPEKTVKNLNSPSKKFDHVLGIMASNWKKTDEEIELLELFVNAGADPHLRCVIENMSLMELACLKNYVRLAKSLICLGIKILKPEDLMTKALKKGNSDVFYLLTHSYQNIRETLHLIKSDGIDQDMWNKVDKFRKNPLSLKSLCRISVKDLKFHGCNETNVPQTLLKFVYFGSEI